ncbi:hypothetical protein GF327_05400 [Candidatus Woesearchaeota archaeon]|nr:hypothetical protein [Candidatus Woesearchaeota archaeon]
MKDTKQINWPQVSHHEKWNRVKTLRKMKNLPQIAVCEGADISITTLWFIEQGYDKKTRYETKKKIADFFQVKVYDLFPAQMIGNRPGYIKQNDNSYESRAK